jgi:hypothetical protein
MPPGTHDESPYYKRMEDQKWRELVDTRLASLTSSENGQDAHIEEIEERLEELFHILHGDANKKDDDGMQGDMRELSRGLNQLRAVMLPDSLGNGGVISRLKRLENKDERDEKSFEARLGFWGKVIAVLIPSAVLIFREWPNISARWNHNMEELNAPRTPLVKKTRRPKRHVQAQVPVQEPDEPKEDIQ